MCQNPIICFNLFFVIAINPLKDGFPKCFLNPKTWFTRQLQKEDAQEVIVFRLSENCIDEKYADIYITVCVNGASQLDYEDKSLNFDRGEDIISKLHYGIVKTELPSETGPSCGMTRQSGRPLVFKAAKPSTKCGSIETSAKFSILFTDPPKDASGTYQMPMNSYKKDSEIFTQTFTFLNQWKNKNRFSAGFSIGEASAAQIQKTVEIKKPAS